MKAALTHRERFCRLCDFQKDTTMIASSDKPDMNERSGPGGTTEDHWSDAVAAEPLGSEASPAGAANKHTGKSGDMGDGTFRNPVLSFDYSDPLAALDGGI